MEVAGSDIEMIDCREGMHPMIERYLPLYDDTVEVFLARDVDSILSQADSVIVSDWLTKEHDVLQ